MRKQKPIHVAGPPGKPLLPLEAEVEILEKLGADLRIGSGEIAAILKKHGVEADVERLQDSYRKRLEQYTVEKAAQRGKQESENGPGGT